MSGPPSAVTTSDICQYPVLVDCRQEIAQAVCRHRRPAKRGAYVRVFAVPMFGICRTPSTSISVRRAPSSCRHRPVVGTSAKCQGSSGALERRGIRHQGRALTPACNVANSPAAACSARSSASACGHDHHVLAPVVALLARASARRSEQRIGVGEDMHRDRSARPARTYRNRSPPGRAGIRWAPLRPR